MKGIRIPHKWNGENRLVRAVEAVHPTNRAPRVVEYAYDHRGRMVCKTIGGTNGPPDKALAYVWDDYNIVRETLTTNHWSLVTHNIWGLDLDGSMQGCGGVGGLLAVVKDVEVYTPTYDANGNISEYVCTNGTIVAHQEYDPFGNAAVSSGDADAFTHWFSTKPWCGVTGMYEYQYRQYGPGMGGDEQRPDGRIWRSQLVSLLPERPLGFRRSICFFLRTRYEFSFQIFRGLLSRCNPFVRNYSWTLSLVFAVEIDAYGNRVIGAVYFGRIKNPSGGVRVYCLVG